EESDRWITREESVEEKLQRGLMSDTHGDLEAVEKSFHILDGCDFILHAGDVLYHGVFNPMVS
ncbi:uncharacterized protein HKBW3S43_01241, partial [Candidatus Hakubella thermalkaliphila]